MVCPLWASMGRPEENPEVTDSQHSSCPLPGSCLKTSSGAPHCLQPSPTQPPITMHSLDEPLDLKLSITKLRAAREKRERALSVVRHRALHRELGLVDDSPTPGSPGSPPSGTAPLVLAGVGRSRVPVELWQWKERPRCVHQDVTTAPSGFQPRALSIYPQQFVYRGTLSPGGSTVEPGFKLGLREGLVRGAGNSQVVTRPCDPTPGL